MRPLIRRIERLERALPTPGEPVTPERLSAWRLRNGLAPDSVLVGWPDVVVLPAEDDEGGAP